MQEQYQTEKPKLKLCKSTKTILGCNRMLPLEAFYPTRSQCKECSRKFSKTERDEMKITVENARKLMNEENNVNQLLNDNRKKDETITLLENLIFEKDLKIKELEDELNSMLLGSVSLKKHSYEESQPSSQLQSYKEINDDVSIYTPAPILNIEIKKDKIIKF